MPAPAVLALAALIYAAVGVLSYDAAVKASPWYWPAAICASLASSVLWWYAAQERDATDSFVLSVGWVAVMTGADVGAAVWYGSRLAPWGWWALGGMVLCGFLVKVAGTR